MLSSFSRSNLTRMVLIPASGGDPGPGLPVGLPLPSCPVQSLHFPKARGPHLLHDSQPSSALSFKVPRGSNSLSGKHTQIPGRLPSQPVSQRGDPEQEDPVTSVPGFPADGSSALPTQCKLLVSHRSQLLLSFVTTSMWCRV